MAILGTLEVRLHGGKDMKNVEFLGSCIILSIWLYSPPWTVSLKYDVLGSHFCHSSLVFGCITGKNDPYAIISYKTQDQKSKTLEGNASSLSLSNMYKPLPCSGFHLRSHSVLYIWILPYFGAMLITECMKDTFNVQIWYNLQCTHPSCGHIYICNVHLLSWWFNVAHIDM